MDEDVKICPECGAEYFAYVEKCKTCEIPLVFPGERPQKHVHKAEGSLICVEEGPHDRMRELSAVIASEGIECKVLNLAGGKGCSTKNGYGLFVPQEAAREAVNAIDRYWLNLHPELKEMDERMSAGLCPACGAEIAVTTAGFLSECPECGLNLGGPPGGSNSTGNCGPGCGPC